MKYPRRIIIITITIIEGMTIHPDFGRVQTKKLGCQRVIKNSNYVFKIILKANHDNIAEVKGNASLLKSCRSQCDLRH